MVQNILLEMDHIIIQYFNQSFSISKLILTKLKNRTKLKHGNLKDCQDKAIPATSIPAILDNSLASGLNYINNAKKRLKLNGGCLKQDKLTFKRKDIVNICFIYEINLQLFNLVNKFLLRNSLFDTYSLSDGLGLGTNVIIFRNENSSSVHIDTRNKNIFVKVQQMDQIMILR